MVMINHGRRNTIEMTQTYSCETSESISPALFIHRKTMYSGKKARVTENHSPLACQNKKTFRKEFGNNEFIISDSCTTGTEEINRIFVANIDLQKLNNRSILFTFNKKLL